MTYQQFMNLPEVSREEIINSEENRRLEREIKLRGFLHHIEMKEEKEMAEMIQANPGLITLN